MRYCLNVQALLGNITGIERYTYEVIAALDRCLTARDGERGAASGGEHDDERGGAAGGDERSGTSGNERGAADGHECGDGRGNERGAAGAHLAQREDLELEAIYPQGTHPKLPELATIRPVEVPGWKGGKDYLALRRYLKRCGATYVNFSGGLAVKRQSIVTFHDLRPYTHPEFDSKGSRVRFGLSLQTAKRLGCPVVTVSEFSKGELVRAGFAEERITLAANGWEHMARVKADAQVFEQHPQLVPGEYYYVLGSLAPHKNLDWVIRVARYNPQCLVALAGKLWEGAQAPADLPDNVHYLGYVSDEQSKALMESCKAFLHPSVYEGFGVPPLEAICCGRRVLAASGTAVEGVFGDALRYFDAHDYTVDLDALADFEPDRKAYDRVLGRYTWRASAHAWLDLLLALAAC